MKIRRLKDKRMKPAPIRLLKDEINAIRVRFNNLLKALGFQVCLRRFSIAFLGFYSIILELLSDRLTVGQRPLKP